MVRYLVDEGLNKRKKHHSQGWLQDFGQINWMSNAAKVSNGEQWGMNGFGGGGSDNIKK